MYVPEIIYSVCLSVLPVSSLSAHFVVALTFCVETTNFEDSYFVFLILNFNGTVSIKTLVLIVLGH